MILKMAFKKTCINGVNNAIPLKRYLIAKPNYLETRLMLWNRNLIYIYKYIFLIFWVFLV